MFLVLFAGNLLAQRKLSGEYFSKQKQFKSAKNTIWVDVYLNGIARFYEKGYVGIVDTNGLVLIDAKYHSIDTVMASTAIVRKGTGQLFIKHNGTVINEEEYGEMTVQPNGLVYVKVTYETTVYNLGGRVVSPNKYDFLGPFQDGRATFARGQTFGWLTEDGEEIVLLKDYLVQRNDQPISYFHMGAILKDREQRQLCNLFEIREGRAISFREKKGAVFYGLIDKNGKKVTPLIYELIQLPVNGRVVAMKGGKYGELNLDGDVIVPFEHDQPTIKTNELQQPAIHLGISVINSEPMNHVEVPQELIEKYQSLAPLTEDLFRGHNGKKWGVVNRNGGIVLDFIHDGVGWNHKENIGIASLYGMSYPLNTGVPRYQYNGTFYFFDQTGKLGEREFFFSQTISDLADYHSEEFVLKGLRVYLPHEYGQQLRVLRSKEKDPPDYVEEINEYFNIIGDSKEMESLGRKYQKFKKGIRSVEKKWIVPQKYDELKKFPRRDRRGNPAFGNLFQVQKEGKYGVVNLFGEEILPCEYSYLTAYAGTIEAAVGVRDENGDQYYKVALFDVNGNELIELQDRIYGRSLRNKWFGMEE